MTIGQALNCKYNITTTGKIKNARSINKRKNQLSPFFSMKYVSQLSHLSLILNLFTNTLPKPQLGHLPVNEFIKY
jgi:hypothetical protein